LKVVELKSYDWLEDAILTVCKKVFPLEPALTVHSIAQKQHRIFPHQDYDFLLQSPDAEFRLILRLHYGMFSLWSGVEDIKTAKEFSVMRHAYQHGYPAPFPYCFSTRKMPFGRAYLIMDAGDGRRWWEMEGSLRAIQEETVDSLADQLAKLHASVSPQHPLIPKIDVPKVLKTLRSRAASLNVAELDKALRVCGKAFEAVGDAAAVLLHGTFEMDNTLLVQNRIRTVTNWEHAAIGDHRWDVAYASLALQQKGDRSLANRFVARYVQQTGASLENMDFWEGLIALRHYALGEWVRSLDERSFSVIAGLQTNLFDRLDAMRDRALAQFG